MTMQFLDVKAVYDLVGKTNKYINNYINRTNATIELDMGSYGNAKEFHYLSLGEEEKIFIFLGNLPKQ